MKPGVADSRAREDDVGEHLSKIGEPVQGEINLPERIRTGNVTSVTWLPLHPLHTRSRSPTSHTSSQETRAALRSTT
jgi:hypothetical protein